MKSQISVVVVAALVVAICGVTNAARRDDDVVSFNVDPEDLKILDMLKQSPGRLGKFAYKNCGDPKTELINVTTLEFTPDPLSFPGTLGVNFMGEFKQTLDAPLKATLVLLRRVGSTWIKIPCVGIIGSCTYDDLCDLLSGATCPPPFITNNVPCKCPFTQGRYKLPQVSFEVDVPVFPPGDYHAIGNLTTGDSGQTFAGCVEIFASFD